MVMLNLVIEADLANGSLRVPNLLGSRYFHPVFYVFCAVTVHVSLLWECVLLTMWTAFCSVHK